MGISRRLQRALAKLRGYPTVESLRSAGVSVGPGVWIGRWLNVDIARPDLLTIGSDTTIAPGAVILTHDASMARHTGLARVAPVAIGSRVFIGANAMVLPGVTIGDGAVIGAGAVVRADVPENAIAIGNPAEVVGDAERFADRHRAKQEAAPDAYQAGGRRR